MRRGAVKRRVCNRSIDEPAVQDGCKSDYRPSLKNPVLRRIAWQADMRKLTMRPDRTMRTDQARDARGAARLRKPYCCF